MRFRHAFTLIELMVVLSACAVVLTTSAAMIHRVMHAQSAAWSFFDVERSASRLSEHFRRDVHQATDADFADTLVDENMLDQKMFLRLDFTTGQTVEYWHSEGVVIRVLSQDDEAISREEFEFSSEIDLSIRGEESPRRLILTIVADPAATLADPDKRALLAHMVSVSLEVEACLGRDVRRVNASVSQEEFE